MSGQDQAGSHDLVRLRVLVRLSGLAGGSGGGTTELRASVWRQFRTQCRMPHFIAGALHRRVQFLEGSYELPIAAMELDRKSPEKRFFIPALWLHGSRLSRSPRFLLHF